MPPCEHSDVCKRDALDEHDGMCILHSKKPDKDEEAFDEALEQHRAEHNEDFRWMVFPTSIEFEEGETLVGSFKDATFLDSVSFQGVSFQPFSVKDEIFNFRHSTFERNASFINVTFEWKASFAGARFQTKGDFTGVTFEKGVSFMGATFREANFMKASFCQASSFLRAFESDEEVGFKGAYFQGASVQGDIRFAGESPNNRAFAGGLVRFDQVKQESGGEISFRYADLRRCHLFGTDLENINFTGVKWCEKASSDGWRCNEWFDRVGIYDEFAKTGGIDPYDPEEWIDRRPWPEIERAYRQLKRNYEARGDYPRGGDFHIGEKVARRKRAWENLSSEWGQWVLLSLYRALSKYGERALPATFWLVGVVLSFALVYVMLGATSGPFCEPVSYSNALLSSLEATFYPVRPVGFETFMPRLTSFVQRLISPVLIALLVLALRQRVKR